jgi:hypothetical protein
VAVPTRSPHTDLTLCQIVEPFLLVPEQVEFVLAFIGWRSPWHPAPAPRCPRTPAATEQPAKLVHPTMLRRPGSSGLRVSRRRTAARRPPSRAGREGRVVDALPERRVGRRERAATALAISPLAGAVWFETIMSPPAKEVDRRVPGGLI